MKSKILINVMECRENEAGLKTRSSVGRQDGQRLISDHRKRSIESIHAKKVKKKCQENITQDQTLLKDFLPLSKSIQPTLFKIKDLNPLASSTQTSGSRCPASPLTEPHSAVFWRRIGQFLCYWHLDSRVWKSQNKTECCFHLDRHKKGSNEWRGESQSFVQLKWSVFSGSQRGNKIAGSFQCEIDRPQLK